MSKYCRFHKGHDHNTDDSIQLRDSTKGFIKYGWLTEYVKGGKRDMEESPKGKSLMKTADVVTSGESKNVSKGKRMYIAAITRGEP